MKDILIFGSGGHAKVVFDIIQKQKLYRVRGFVSLNESLNRFLDLPHYSQDQFASIDVEAGVVAIGDNHVRSQVVDFILLQKKDFQFISAVHPTASLGLDVQLGAGTVVMANAVVNPGSRIGSHVIINTSASVDHDTSVGHFASLAPAAVLGGYVKVGDFTAVSLGAMIIHGQSVGSHTVIGAGAVVLKSLGDFRVAYGNPCRDVRARIAGEKYL